MKKDMVERDHPQLSVRRQCELLGVNRNRLGNEAVSVDSEKNEVKEPNPVSEEVMNRVKRIMELHLKHPTFDTRRMAICLTRAGMPTTRWEARQLMKRMNVRAIYQKPRTTIVDAKARKYPYLLKDIKVRGADQAWCADITYIPVGRGFVYLVAIMDWYTRAVLAWRVSNTMDTHFCLEAFREAVQKAGCVPEIFNTDQGSQFTSEAWIGEMESLGIKVSMDGKGRWVDNVYIERLWRSVKYEGVRLWEIRTIARLKEVLEEWFESYNRFKPHKANAGLTPWECYRPSEPTEWRKTA